MDGNPLYPVPYMTKGERRSGRVLINAGYRYIRSRVVQERAIYWRCARSTCRQTLVTNFFDVSVDKPADIEIIRGAFQEHIHEPDFNILERRQFIEETLDVIKQNPATTIKRAYDIVVSRGTFNLVEIPAFKGIKSQLQRLKRTFLAQAQGGHIINNQGKDPIQLHQHQLIGQAARKRKLDTSQSSRFNGSEFVPSVSPSSSIIHHDGHPNNHHPITDRSEFVPSVSPSSSIIHHDGHDNHHPITERSEFVASVSRSSSIIHHDGHHDNRHPITERSEVVAFISSSSSSDHHVGHHDGHHPITDKVDIGPSHHHDRHHLIMEEVDIKPKILNQPRSALDLAIALQRCILKMKAACITEDGSGIDYSKLRQSDLYMEYQSKTRELQIIDLQPLTSDQRKAFFINIYNALTIDALAAQPELPSTILDVQDFWKSSSYVIAGQVYSLDDIEHGILRKNKPHPSTEKRCFHANDPRLPFMVDSLDARIHFALNCGAESCPPISVYTEENLERGLQMASYNYLNQGITVDIESKQINLPSLLKWYGSDAAPTDVEVVRWTIPFLDKGKAAQVQELVAAWEMGSEVAIGYRPYNWKVNSINKEDA